jgi:hypothetical protein
MSLTGCWKNKKLFRFKKPAYAGMDGAGKIAGIAVIGIIYWLIRRKRN